ncbi:unnamed protein product, partial [Meganyctiphanes norvegica]
MFRAIHFKIGEISDNYRQQVAVSSKISAVELYIADRRQRDDNELNSGRTFERTFGRIFGRTFGRILYNYKLYFIVLNMTIYNLYMFDRDGTLLYYGEWNRHKQAGMSRDENNSSCRGVILSVYMFYIHVSPTDVKEGFLSYCTNKYRLNLYESPSRIKFILNTDIHAQGVKELLHQIYTQVYVEYVVYNPMCKLGTPIESELFAAKLDETIKQSPLYVSRSS